MIVVKRQHVRIDAAMRWILGVVIRIVRDVADMKNTESTPALALKCAQPCKVLIQLLRDARIKCRRRS